MATNSVRPADPQRIPIRCSCGKSLIAHAQYAGKHVKCPACGQSVVVPTSPASASADPESQGLSRKTLTAMWSFAALFALICLAFVVWHSNFTRKQQLAAANQRLSEAVAAAKEWASGNSSIDGAVIEKQLVDALADANGTDNNDGEAILKQVRERRGQIEEENRIKASQLEATAIFRDAKKHIDSKHLAEGVELLRTYLSHPNAGERAEAERLVAEAETAQSDTVTLDALVSMNDEAFNRASTTKTIDDGKVTHPVLVAVRTETVQRTLDKATQRRAELKSMEEARRKTEELAAMERQREEEERQLQEKERKQAEEAERRLAVEPYDLKGDRLGMSLDAFKAKYARRVRRPGQEFRRLEDRDEPEIAPNCFPSQPWHGGAGIITCSIVLSFEDRKQAGATIAEVETEVLLHDFVDGKLYSIRALLPHDGYHKVKQGLVAKHGPPKREQEVQLKTRLGASFTGELLVWENDVSRIYLEEFSGDLNTTYLSFTHLELSEIVSARTPKPTGKDL